jgi:peptidoglycan/LPS O-acetylase OafA/YrhL
MAHTYRPEIDGLRALAVLPVVLFHAGVPGFTGGFVGVDVFFVISGYLITGILLSEGRGGNVSIARFYERRIRRIAPALLTVLIASSLAAYLLLFPGQLVAYARSLIGTELFVSNILFWRESGYFGAQGSVMPLLHTWSLAVEEQFYLVVPLLIWWLASRPRILAVVVVAAMVLSFVLNCIAVQFTPSAAFYLIPTRAWELLIGSVIALDLVKSPRSRPVAEAVAVAGLALIVCSIAFLDERITFPGFWALLPTFGTGAFIVATRHVDTYAGRAMSWRPLVAIGLISYSLYLWHWPVIAFARQYVGGPLGTTAMAAVIGISFLAAIATWKLVEQPTRNRAVVSSRRLIAGTAAAALVLLGVGVAIVVFDGIPGRFHPRVLLLAAGTQDTSPTYQRCGGESVTVDDANCHIGIAGEGSFVLAGDSHAGAIAEGVSLAAREAGRGGTLAVFNACPALFEWHPSHRSASDRHGCVARNRAVFERVLNDPKTTGLVTVAYWNAYQREDPANLDAALKRTAELMAKAGKRLIIIHGLPEPGFDVPWSLAVASARGRTSPTIAAPSEPLVRFPASAEHIDLQQALCPDGECIAQVNGRPTYIDDDHISRSASEMIVAPFLNANRIFR